MKKYFSERYHIKGHSVFFTKPYDRDGGKSFSDRFLKELQCAYQGTCARDDKNTKTYWFPKNHLNLGVVLQKLPQLSDTHFSQVLNKLKK